MKSWPRRLRPLPSDLAPWEGCRFLEWTSREVSVAACGKTECAYDKIEPESSLQTMSEPRH